MPVKLWQSQPPRTPFAPRWVVPLFNEMLGDPAVLAELKQIALAREEWLKSTIDPVPIAGLAEGTTARWHGFNTFVWEEPAMRTYQAFVRESYRRFMDNLKLPRPRTWIQGWVNILGRGERLASHCHDQTPTAFLSGNFCVAAAGSATLYYPPYVSLQDDHPGDNCLAVKNTPGLLTLFPSTVFHATTPHEGDDKRISLAFDIHVEDRDALGVTGAGGRHVLFDEGNAG